MFALLHRPLVSLGIIASIAAGIVLLANAQQPVLKISDLGTNVFDIAITNAVSATNYTLFWTPALQDPNYPWNVVAVGSIGQSNFMMDVSGWNAGFFKVLLGSDEDGDGVPSWLDAQPLNPSVGVLTITIDSPVNGALLQ